MSPPPLVIHSLHMPSGSIAICIPPYRVLQRCAESWDEDLMFLQLAFNTAKHEATRATPFEAMFPFLAGSPFLHQWGIGEFLATTVRVPAFAGCGRRCALTCSATIRLWPEGITEGGPFIPFMQAIWYSVGTILLVTLHVRFRRNCLLAGVGPCAWTAFSRRLQRSSWTPPLVVSLREHIFHR
jgi:hypothetical protein